MQRPMATISQRNTHIHYTHTYHTQTRIHTHTHKTNAQIYTYAHIHHALTHMQRTQASSATQTYRAIQRTKRTGKYAVVLRAAATGEAVVSRGKCTPYNQ